jgi:hypothetical protein
MLRYQFLNKKVANKMLVKLTPVILIKLKQRPYTKMKIYSIGLPLEQLQLFEVYGR